MSVHELDATTMRAGRAYGLLGSASGWELHLLGLRLLDFLGRHVCERFVFEEVQKSSCEGD